MDITTAVALAGAEAAAILILRAEGLLSGGRRFATVFVFLTVAFGARLLCMPHETLDWINFLSVWISRFKEGGGFAALAEPIGNYNVPYLYFIALFSYSDANALYLIKLLSILFDIILAWSCARLVGVFSKSEKKRLFAFIAVLLLPTVVLNGALWGQCDSIYTAFAVIGVCSALKGRPSAAMAAFALSFAFKLQAVFILPVILVLLWSGKIKIPHLAIFPLGYFAVVLPAVLCGKPFIDTITLYFNQADSVGSGLNYNSPSVFALLNIRENTGFYAKLGIAASFAATAALLIWFFIRRKRLGSEAILTVSLIFAVFIPFLLPHMHDRYFFLADILSLVFAVVFPRFFAVPALTSFASLLGYHAYLKMRYLFPMSYGSVALIAVIIILTGFLIHLFCSRGRSTREYGHTRRIP